MDLSVIIPCRNEVEHIIECIDSLLLNCKNYSFEILIIDGESNDGTRELLKKKYLSNNHIKLLDNPGKITPIAFNLGIFNSKGKNILIAGARHILSQKYVSQCINELNNNPDIAGVGGRVVNLFTDEISRSVAIAMKSKFGVGMGNYRALNKSCYVDTIGTPMYRKNIFDSIGLFDESLVRNQDDELNYRIVKNGYKLWLNKDITISYYVRSSFLELYRQYLQYGYWKVQVNKKHKTITTIRQLFPSMLIMTILSFVISIPLLPVSIVLFISFPLIAYLIALLTVSILNAFSIISVFQIGFAILSLHFGYGLGYLKGIVDFLFLKTNPDSNMKKITR